MSSGTLRRGIARARPDGAWRTWLLPVERREFWAIQVLVLIIAAVHSWIEYQHLLDEHSPVYLFPTTLYLIPIVYAAVNFGLRGSLLTALWSAVLVMPNLVLWHEGLEQAGEIVQVAWITIAAVFVGSRVDRERVARLEAESRETALRASEERYRAIVDNVEEPIIVLDDRRRVIEANASAADLLGSNVNDLRGGELRGPVGGPISDTLASNGASTVDRRVLRLGEPLRWYELVRMSLARPTGADRIQLLLRDVTTSYERERGLEGITRQTLAARDEEQRRIAREIHDGPLQTLIQLWRDLDSLAAQSPVQGSAHLLAARDTTEAVADELRRFSRDLRPSVLDDLGAVAAIRTEVELFTRRTSIDGQFRTSGASRRLDASVELALLRITQEALRNAERHSGATSIAVEVAFRADGVELAISDDGTGLPSIPTPSELLAHSHMGMIGMQERARLVNGRLSFGRAEQGGLSVRVDVPTPLSARDA